MVLGKLRSLSSVVAGQPRLGDGGCDVDDLDGGGAGHEGSCQVDEVSTADPTWSGTAHRGGYAVPSSPGGVTVGCGPVDR